jgi:exopolyphosphatase/guanosine-5'-triphosphate,3'-diphosphate pyrophosphatase
MPREHRASDVDAVREQLGRDPTTRFEVVARCPVGHPLVIRNEPLDEHGEPFPTTFWLTCPDAVRAVSRVEAGGEIGRLNERYDADRDFAAAVDRAHAEAAEERGRLLAAAREWGGVGGTRRGIKCLHAHFANHLVGGDDVVGAAVADAVEPIHPAQVPGERIAVVDQGTHSCRLLVVERASDGTLIELANDMVITALGAGVDASGALDPAAVARNERVLARYVRRARALGASTVHVTATSAVRDASNPELYVASVLRHVDTAPRVIDGTEEARLSFLGGTYGLPSEDGPFLLLDIGGGSTEFVVGREPGRAEQRVSTQMGSVRMTERAISTDPPAPGELETLQRLIADHLDEAEVAVPEIHTARTFVAVSGTATTFQAIALGLDRDDPDRIHRTWLALPDAERVLDDLCRMTAAERSALPVMAPGRGDVIVAGGAILVGTMRRFGIQRALVSETDILWGLAYDALGVG